MNCRHCKAELVLPFIDLQTSPPSNAYLDVEQLAGPEVWFPLRVRTCTRCWLVQTEDYAHFADLFAHDYAYFSSFSTSWLDHALCYVDAMVDRFGLDVGSKIVEVASNDGYLLQYAVARGIPSLGVEPTASTAAAAREKGIEVVEEFFGVDLAARLVAQGHAADLTAANNVLAHVPDINDFVAGFARILKPQGVSTFEFPHLMRLIADSQFDTIYHEHFSYLSLTAVETIFQANGLDVFDVEELPTHGGSLRVYAQRSDTGAHTVSPRVKDMLAREDAAGLRTEEYYAGFQAKAEKIKDDFVEFLIKTKRDGATVGAYGAAAKGNTLMNFAGVRSDLVPWVVDKNPAKAGRYMPGSRIPIIDEAHLKASKPRYVVILPWNLKAEIMTQLAYIRDWGGEFVTAVPKLSVA